MILTKYLLNICMESMMIRLNELYICIWFLSTFQKCWKHLAKEKLKTLVDQLSETYNTTSSSLSILALDSYYTQGLDKIKHRRGLGEISVVEWLENGKNKLQLTGSLFPESEFSPHASKIKISNNSQYIAYFSIIQEGFDRSSGQPSFNNGIEVLREFIDADGYVRDNVGLGEELTVRLRARSFDSYVPSIVIVDLLPGGFEVVLDSIDRKDTKVEYVDAREDRVLIFTHFKERIKEVYTYKIKAINKGRYKVPPIFAESMYDRQLQSKGIMTEIVVE